MNLQCWRLESGSRPTPGVGRCGREHRYRSRDSECFLNRANCSRGISWVTGLTGGLGMTPNAWPEVDPSFFKRLLCSLQHILQQATVVSNQFLPAPPHICYLTSAYSEVHPLWTSLCFTHIAQSEALWWGQLTWKPESVAELNAPPRHCRGVERCFPRSVHRSRLFCSFLDPPGTLLICSKPN